MVSKENSNDKKESGETPDKLPVYESPINPPAEKSGADKPSSSSPKVYRFGIDESPPNKPSSSNPPADKSPVSANKPPFKDKAIGVKKISQRRVLVKKSADDSKTAGSQGSSGISGPGSKADKQEINKKPVKFSAPGMNQTYRIAGPSNYFRIMNYLVSAIFFIIIILLGVILAYILYMNLPGEPQRVRVLISGDSNFDNESLSPVKQFYPNMKYNHNIISYKIDPNCDEEKKTSILAAFLEISDKVGVISFMEVQENYDIELLCSGGVSYKADYFIAGEGGAKEVVQTKRYSVINRGAVLLYGNSEDYVRCDYPNIEMHELLHAFGFDHSSDSNSIMYPYLDSCSQLLDSSIVDELNRLYSEENLPDLYFVSLSTIKKGRYLDFNMTIKNSGTIKATNVSFTILDEGEFVNTTMLKDIDYGGGISVEIKNFKLLHRNPEKITFVIDYDKLIKEIDENNNLADINL